MVRKDYLTSLIDALKSRDLTPARFDFDKDGNLVALHLKSVAPPPAAQEKSEDDRERPVKRMSALASLSMRHPPAA